MSAKTSSLDGCFDYHCDMVIRSLAVALCFLFASSAQADPTPSEVAPAAATGPSGTTPSTTPSTTAAPPAPTPESSATLLERVRFGARLGANFASVATVPKDNRSFMKPGLALGGFASFEFYNRFEIELGLGYSQRGFQLDAASPTQSDPKVALHYIEVPVLTRMRVAWGRSAAHLRLTAGLNLLLLDSAHSSDNDERIDIEDQVTSTDVALVVGAGIDFDFGSSIGLLDFRYDHGLVNTVDGTPGIEAYNRVAALFIGAAF